MMGERTRAYRQTQKVCSICETGDSMVEVVSIEQDDDGLLEESLFVCAECDICDHHASEGSA